jgi:hypothetical protein
MGEWGGRYEELMSHERDVTIQVSWPADVSTSTFCLSAARNHNAHRSVPVNWFLTISFEILMAEKNQEPLNHLEKSGFRLRSHSSSRVLATQV